VSNDAVQYLDNGKPQSRFKLQESKLWIRSRVRMRRRLKKMGVALFVFSRGDETRVDCKVVAQFCALNTESSRKRKEREEERGLNVDGEIAILNCESNLVKVCHTLGKRKVSGQVVDRVNSRRFDVLKARMRKSFD